MKTPTTKLERAVLRIMRHNADVKGGYTLKDVYHDLINHGCKSGMIGELIYYKDTIAFYHRHLADITAIFEELISDTGERIDVLLPDFDIADPLALDTLNQNLLAWFGFEEAARRMFDED